MMMLAGLAVAALAWWLLKSAAKAEPKALAGLVRRAGGFLSLGAALLLLLRGRLDMALLLGGAGAWLLGWHAWPFPSLFGRLTKPAGSVSRVRSALIEMEFDPATRRIGGMVLAGPFFGRSLDELGPVELRQLGELCRREDPEGLRLLQAYLDRRFAGRREDAERDAHAGPRADPQRGAMTQEEAYQVLGLEPGADADVIRRAHRNLMKKLHPDQGGSTYLASRVNQAKDVLLHRHR
jgi:hypothetical protein